MAPSEKRSSRFIASGGYVERKELTRPKLAIACGLNLMWFSGFLAASSILQETLLPYLSSAAIVQVLGIIAAIIVFRVERPFEVTVLVENPNKKPHALY